MGISRTRLRDSTRIIDHALSYICTSEKQMTPVRAAFPRAFSEIAADRGDDPACLQLEDVVLSPKTRKTSMLLHSITMGYSRTQSARYSSSRYSMNMKVRRSDSAANMAPALLVCFLSCKFVGLNRGLQGSHIWSGEPAGESQAHS